MGLHFVAMSDQTIDARVIGAISEDITTNLINFESSLSSRLKNSVPLFLALGRIINFSFVHVTKVDVSVTTY